MGKSTGLFATRTPHRPCPIGLSVVKLEEVHAWGKERYLIVSSRDEVFMEYRYRYRGWLSDSGHQALSSQFRSNRERDGSGVRTMMFPHRLDGLATIRLSERCLLVRIR